MKKAKMKRVAHCVTVSRRLLEDFKEKAGKYYSLNQLIELAMSDVFETPLNYHSLKQYILNRPRLIKNKVSLSTGSYDEKIKITVRLNSGFNEKCQEFIDMNEWRGFSHMVTLAMINARGVE